jgi:hypothetical protein
MVSKLKKEKEKETGTRDQGRILAPRGSPSAGDIDKIGRVELLESCLITLYPWCKMPRSSSHSPPWLVAPSMECVGCIKNLRH